MTTTLADSSRNVFLSALALAAPVSSGHTVPGVADPSDLSITWQLPDVTDSSARTRDGVAAQFARLSLQWRSERINRSSDLANP